MPSYPESPTRAFSQELPGSTGVRSSKPSRVLRPLTQHIVSASNQPSQVKTASVKHPRALALSPQSHAIARRASLSNATIGPYLARPLITDPMPVLSHVLWASPNGRDGNRNLRGGSTWEMRRAHDVGVKYVIWQPNVLLLTRE